MLSASWPEGVNDDPLVQPEALSRSVVEMLEQDGTLSGISEYVEEFGHPDENEEDEGEQEAAAAALPQGLPGQPPEELEAQPAEDARPATLYVSRRVENAAEILQWAEEQGISGLEPAEELHVTITYSRDPVDWIKMDQPWDETITIGRGGPRALDLFGPQQDVLVLQFASSDLQWRHMSMRERGASWDWEDYLPHITLAKGQGEFDLSAVRPYTGRIELGPEIFEEVKE